MKLDKIKSDTYTRKPGSPIFLEGGSTAILGIHGYNGYTEDLRYTAEQLNKNGFTVSVPRLPGHATNASDFFQTGANDWLRRAVDSYFDLKTSYDNVYVYGLSMGSVLTLLLASKFEIDRIAVVAPAVMTTDNKIKLTPIMKHFITKTKRNWRGEEKNEDDKYLASQYWKWFYIPQIAELLKLQKLCKKRLKNVNSDLLTIVSKMDDQVPVEAADIIESKVSSKIFEKAVLEKSPHVATNGPEKDKVAELLINWFKK